MSNEESRLEKVVDDNHKIVYDEPPCLGAAWSLYKKDHRQESGWKHLHGALFTPEQTIEDVVADARSLMVKLFI